MGLRKNQNKLTDPEKTRYVEAVIQMKASGSYNPLVLIHDDIFKGLADPNRDNPAHRCSAFLPWHRYFLLKFETALKAADTTLGRDGDISIPYWDWTHDDESTQNRQRGSLWKKNFLGWQGDPVDTGPFKSGSWTLAKGGSLVRKFGQHPQGTTLPSKTDVDNVLAIHGYDCTPFGQSASGETSIPNPSAPTVASVAPGGALVAGTYRVLITYVNPRGETRPSPESTILLSAVTNAIEVSSPPSKPSATGYNVYITPANGATNTATLQGGLRTIGSATTITTIAAGKSLPTMNSTGSFRNFLEGWISTRSQAEVHNRVHLWVGGSMIPNTSPDDPIFFMHHCNIDRLWALWQFQHPGQNYPTSADSAQANHRLDGEMSPWNTAAESKRPSDVLNHTSLGYTYDTDPSGMSISVGP